MNSLLFTVHIQFLFFSQIFCKTYLGKKVSDLKYWGTSSGHVFALYNTDNLGWCCLLAPPKFLSIADNFNEEDEYLLGNSVDLPGYLPEPIKSQKEVKIGVLQLGERLERVVTEHFHSGVSFMSPFLSSPIPSPLSGWGSLHCREEEKPWWDLCWRNPCNLTAECTSLECSSMAFLFYSDLSYIHLLISSLLPPFVIPPKKKKRYHVQLSFFFYWFCSSSSIKDCSVYSCGCLSCPCRHHNDKQGKERQ